MSVEDDRRKRNREMFPFMAAEVDKLNEVFGPVKLRYAKNDNGDELGRPLPVNGYWTADQWIKLGELMQLQEQRRKRK